jgi:hypothetical protein
MRAARRNKLQVPTRILSMYRALLTVETVANQLGTRDGLRLVGREFFLNLVSDEFVAQLSDPSNPEAMFVRLVSLKRESPGQLSQILTDLAAGSLTIRMETSEAGNTTRTRNRRARLITSAILTVNLSLLLTNSHLPVFFGISLRWPSAIALLCLYVWIFWQWRHL